MNINFVKQENKKLNKMFLFIPFEGGDADTDHPEEIEFKEINLNNYTEPENLKVLEKIIDNYKILSKILEDTDNDYDSILREYGEEIAKLYDNAPNDPQADYQFKCYFNSRGMELRAYDENGVFYKSDIR